MIKVLRLREHPHHLDPTDAQRLESIIGGSENA
jgi:hypothetical protein